MYRLLTCSVALLAGCGGGPPAPDWQLASRGALTNYQAAYFSGAGRASDADFARVRNEIGATGRPDLAARAELYRCALQTASLELDECPGYQRHAADAAPAERAYAAYLAGKAQASDSALLPASQQAALARGSEALAGMEDPLARLVAAGVLLRMGRITPQGIATAIDAASANGWRRPLLAWLGVELKRVEATGDSQAAALLRRRIELAGGKGA